MTSLPEIYNTLLVRTDFSDDEAWQALCTAVATPSEDGFLAYVHIVDDPAYHDLTPEQIVEVTPASARLLIVADKVAVMSTEWPLLAIHLTDEGPEYLRVIAAELWSIENNISLSNMGWEEFARAADDEGVFRGF